MSLMVGDFAASAFAAAEAGFRVNPRMVMALMTAPPCFPVAPAIRRVFDIVVF